MKLGSTNHSINDSSQSANRAEEIRRRRTQRSQQRVSTVGHRITNPANPRPVLVRGNTRKGFPWQSSSPKVKAPIVNTPIYSKASQRGARRQFYLTMDRTAGTELRLPALPTFHPSWRLFSGMIAILAMLGIYSMMNSSYFMIESIQLTGLKRLSAETIDKEIHLENLSIIEIDPGAIQEKLTTAFPELINVKVDVQLPNFVTITAKERTPVIAVKKGDQVTWIDAEGVPFAARGKASKLITIKTDDALPLAPAPVDSAVVATQAAGDQPSTADSQTKPAKIPVTGLQKIDPALITAAQGLSKKLPANTTLVYSQQDGLGWTNAEGTQVFIGKDLSDFKEKYTLYTQVTKYLSDQGQKAVLISVEHLNAPFYRLEQ